MGFLIKSVLSLLVLLSLTGCTTDTNQKPTSSPTPTNPQQKPEQQIKS